jgi:hypothetical protein
MKKKMFLLIALVGCVVFTFFSCTVNAGGTIIVNNNSQEEIGVSVYSNYSESGILFSYDEHCGYKKISPGSSASWDVGSNTNYGIEVQRTGKNDYITEREVSGGDVVEVDIN